MSNKGQSKAKFKILVNKHSNILEAAEVSTEERFNEDNEHFLKFVKAYLEIIKSTITVNFPLKETVVYGTDSFDNLLLDELRTTLYSYQVYCEANQAHVDALRAVANEVKRVHEILFTNTRELVNNVKGILVNKINALLPKKEELPSVPETYNADIISAYSNVDYLHSIVLDCIEKGLTFYLVPISPNKSRINITYEDEEVVNSDVDVVRFDGVLVSDFDDFTHEFFYTRIDNHLSEIKKKKELEATLDLARKAIAKLTEQEYQAILTMLELNKLESVKLETESLEGVENV